MKKRICSKHQTVITLAEEKIALAFCSPIFKSTLLRSISHLQSKDEAEWTIHLCDRASWGSLPPFPWDHEYLPRGKIKGANRGCFKVSFDTGTHTLSLLDTQEKIGYFWAPDFSVLPYWIQGAFLLTHFQWIVEEKKGTLIHAAAVGNKKGGIILPAKGGSGKSTTALLCLDSKLSYAADDYCFLRANFAVYSIYNSLKLDWNTYRQFFLKKAPSNEEGEKALVFLYPEKKEKLIASFPLKAILIPKITGEKKTRITPCSKREALLALAPSSLFQLQGATETSLHTLGECVKKFPTFRLELGNQFASILPVIENFLEADVC